METTEDSLTMYNLRTWQLDPACNSTGGGSQVTFPFIKIYRPLSIQAVKLTDNTPEIMHWVMNVTPLEEEVGLNYKTNSLVKFIALGCMISRDLSLT